MSVNLLRKLIREIAVQSLHPDLEDVMTVSSSGDGRSAVSCDSFQLSSVFELPFRKMSDYVMNRIRSLYSGNKVETPALDYTPKKTLQLADIADRESYIVNVFVDVMLGDCNYLNGEGEKSYTHDELARAANEFQTVEWDEIQSEIDQIRNEVGDQLESRDMPEMSANWNLCCDELKSVLSKRHSKVSMRTDEILSVY